MKDLSYEEIKKYGPYSYTVCEDSNYTYLEFDFEGMKSVIVVLNEDMIAPCFSFSLDRTNYVGVTPNGTQFDADIRNWCFRKGAGTTDIPSEFQKTWEMIREDDDIETFYYYENAKVISIPDYWGVPAIAVTADNELTGMEGITLVGLGNNGGLTIKAKGNFIITDNS